MIKVGEMIEVNIDRMAFGGEGVARYHGLVIFVPDTVTGDFILCQLVTVKKDYARAQLVKVTTPSQHRIKPPCNVSSLCGGCQWQFIDYEYQLQTKQSVIIDSFQRIAKINPVINPVIPNPNREQSRVKVQYSVQIDKIENNILIGYFQKGTHNVINLEYCSVQPNIINKITEFIRKQIIQLNILSINITDQCLIRHVVYRYSVTQNNIIVVLVIHSNKISDALRQLCINISSEFPHVDGVLVNHNLSKSSSILGNMTTKIVEKSFIIENIGGYEFQISAESFFQVNPIVAQLMLSEVYQHIEENIFNGSVLDVYSGVGLFALYVSQITSRVVCVEESKSAVNDLRNNIQNNSLENKIQWIQGNADHILPLLLRDKESFDLVILDPPRQGCSIDVIKSTVRLAKSFILYISCNPTTLARDVKIILEHGFSIQSIQPYDMFSYTYHIETIVLIKKIS